MTMSGINRRVFIREGALALVALGLPPEFVARPLLARIADLKRQKILVCVFQRGAVDGLSMVIPFGEKAYARGRSSIAIAAPRRGSTGGAIDLDGFFGLHPALAPLHEMFVRRELGMIHAVGSPNPSRSHFDAQDFMETATPGNKNTRDGWLNRTLAHTSCAECAGRTLADPAAHAADHAAGRFGLQFAADSPLRGIAVGGELPRALRGRMPTMAIPDLERFGVAGGHDRSIESTFTRMYRTDDGDLLSGAADESFRAIDLLRKADPGQYRPRSGVRYPPRGLGRSLRQIAQLIKADVGVQIAFADVGGWDTHAAQGGAEGQLAGRLGEFARSLRAFHDDLGDRMEDVVVLTMSEFGRTVAENGTGGTDHGHANCMLVMGGGVAGGRVHGDWPGVEREQLYEGRDLAVTTDFRDVFAEIVTRHLGAARLERVFPGYAVDPRRYPGVLG